MEGADVCRAVQIQLHVTSCLALIRAAEDELIRNKVGASCHDPQ